MSSQFVLEVGISAAIGNALAIGIHTFTWRLRKRVWIFMSSIGALTLLCYILGLLIFDLFETNGIQLDIDDHAPYPFNAMEFWLYFLGVLTTSFAVIGLVGALHKREMGVSWIVASLCFCFELGLSFVALPYFVFLHVLPAMSPRPTDIFIKTGCVVFAVSVFVLALFRPLFLVMLKYICRYLNFVSA